MKKFVLCLDGTWNTDAAGAPATNVLKLHRGIAKSDSAGIEQRSHYIRGIASTAGESAQFLKGAVGLGSTNRVQKAYEHLCGDYEPGDEIHIFGFSRGAFEARSLAGLISLLGVAKRGMAVPFASLWTLYRQAGTDRDPTALSALRASAHYPARVKCVGVWDTVGNIGNPFYSGGWIAPKYAFQNTQLPEAVEVGLHALSIDEVRGPFRPQYWTLPEGTELPKHQRIEQVWFAGVHADVGGGYKETALSDIALLWMAERARDLAGLSFDMESLRRTTRPDPLGAQHVSAAGSLFKWSGLLPFIRLIQQSLDAIPPLRRSLIGSWRTGKVRVGERMVGESIHDSVLQRFGHKVNEIKAGRSSMITYRPRNLAAVIPKTGAPATPSLQSSKSKRVKVFSVHGTFAHETEWDNWLPEKWSPKESADADGAGLNFVTKLSRHLSKHNVLLEEADHTQYNWSGGNSHDERRVSAIGLKKLMERVLTEREKRHGKDYYDGGVFVIGHSHGGTISRLAMNLWDKDDHYHDPDAAEIAHDDKCQHCMQGRNGEVGPNTAPRPDGVITLGSPFVEFEKRSGGMRAVKFGVWLFRFLALLVVGMGTLLWYLLLKAGEEALATTGLQNAETDTAWLVVWPLAWAWLLGLWLPQLVRKWTLGWFGDGPLRLAVGAAITAVRVGVLAALAVYYATLLLGGDLADGWQRVTTLPLLNDEALRHKLWWAVPFIFFWMIAVSIPGRILKWMNEKVEGLRDKLPMKYDPPEGRPTTYLSYLTMGDEAGLGLRIHGFLTWLIQTLAAAASSVLLAGAILVPLMLVALVAIWVISTSEEKEALDPFIAAMDWLTWYPAAVWQWLAPHFGWAGDVPLTLGQLDNKYELVGSMPAWIIGSVFVVFVSLLPSIFVALLIAHVVSNWLRSANIGFGSEKLAWTLANHIAASRVPNENTMMRVFSFAPQAWMKGEMAHCTYYKHDGLIEDIAGYIADWRKVAPSQGWPIGGWIGKLARWLVVALCVLAIFALAVNRSVTVPKVVEIIDTLNPKTAPPDADPGASGTTKAVTPEPSVPGADPAEAEPDTPKTPDLVAPSEMPKTPEDVGETPAAPAP